MTPESTKVLIVPEDMFIATAQKLMLANKVIEALRDHMCADNDADLTWDVVEKSLAEYDSHK